MEDKFYRGIVTGLNGAYVIDEETKERLIAEDEHSAEVIKPWLRGRDIKHWQINWDNQYLIAIQNSGDKDANNPLGKRESKEKAFDIFVSNFPAIANHLLQYKSALEKRNDQGHYWWELRACAYYSSFDKPKIVWPDIAPVTSFTFDRNGFYGGNTMYFIPTEDLQFSGFSIQEW